MKVLQVVHQFLPANVGGTQIYAYNLCKELSKTCDIRLLFTRMDRRKKQYSTREGEYNGLPYTEVIGNHYRSGFVETYQDARMDEIFTRELEGFNPDIIHIHHLLHLSTDFIRIARDRDIPLVFTLHDFWLTCPRWGQRRRPDNAICFKVDPDLCAVCLMDTSIIPSRLDKLVFATMDLLSDRSVSDASPSVTPPPQPSAVNLFVKKNYKKISALFKPKVHGGLSRQVRERLVRIRELCSLVDLFVTPTRFLKDDAVQVLGIPEDRIVASPHGLDSSRYRTYRKKPSTNLRFGYVGVLAEHKGVHVLVEAFNRVDTDRVELNIFGGFTDPSLQGYIALLKRSIENPNIRLRGGFEPSDVSRIFSEIDILVVPSIWFETFSIVIHEAFAFGIPVIATDLGAMAEVVRHGENGLLFKLGDPDDLYEKIKTVIDDRRIIDRLSGGIKPLKTIERDAGDFKERYLSLLNRA